MNRDQFERGGSRRGAQREQMFEWRVFLLPAHLTGSPTAATGGAESEKDSVYWLHFDPPINAPCIRAVNCEYNIFSGGPVVLKARSIVRVQRTTNERKEAMFRNMALTRGQIGETV